MAMTIKGTGFLARQSLMIDKFGKDVWDAFVDEVKADVPFLNSATLPSRKIPIQEFLLFNDKLVERFFKGDVKAHWMFGQSSADWALTQGPYKNFFGGRDVRSFIRAVPALWSAYYDQGKLSGEVNENNVDVTLVDVPVKHVYFEFTVMGYIHRGLELVGTTVHRHEALSGFSLGQDHVHYRFAIS